MDVLRRLLVVAGILLVFPVEDARADDWLQSRFASPAGESARARQPVRKARARAVVPIVLRKGGGFYSADMMYQVRGALYASDADEFYSAEGLASWYGPGFHGKKTANGEVYDQFALTAAHKTLPIPSLARVTNLDNGRSILVRINDRGPFVADRIIDLSQASAAALDMQVSGVGRVRVDYVGVAPLDGRADAEKAHLAEQPWAQGSGVAAMQQHRVASNTRVEPATSVVRTARHKLTIGKLVLPRPSRAARKAAVDTTPVALRSACWTCSDVDRP